MSGFDDPAELPDDGPAELLDESTLPSRRQSGNEHSAPAETAVSARRRSGAETPPSIDPDDGSTIVVRRGARQTAPTTGFAAEQSKLTPTAQREEAARTLEARSNDVQIYAVRNASPARIERAAPAARSEHRPVDGNAVRRAVGRRRMRAAIVIVAASLGLVLAIAALTALLSLNA
ncbi:hypothetical protein [Microbacterium marmarense]|uniref:Uncharacterized protein n=1 Tax=Microbacterium marmarense TaxID=3122051 RepID=A0ABU8LXI0_9MICO